MASDSELGDPQEWPVYQEEQGIDDGQQTVMPPPPQTHTHQEWPTHHASQQPAPSRRSRGSGFLRHAPAQQRSLLARLRKKRLILCDNKKLFNFIQCRNGGQGRLAL